MCANIPPVRKHSPMLLTEPNTRTGHIPMRSHMLVEYRDALKSTQTHPHCGNMSKLSMDQRFMLIRNIKEFPPTKIATVIKVWEVPIKVPITNNLTFVLSIDKNSGTFKENRHTNGFSEIKSEYCNSINGSPYKSSSNGDNFSPSSHSSPSSNESG